MGRGQRNHKRVSGYSMRKLNGTDRYGQFRDGKQITGDVIGGHNVPLYRFVAGRDLAPRKANFDG